MEQQAKQLGAQVDRQKDISQMATSIADFCQRIQTGLAKASFAQKWTLVELLVDRVMVINDQVEIRYVVPTHSRSETTRFCHLRKDYFNAAVQISIAAMLGLGTKRFPDRTRVRPLRTITTQFSFSR